MLNQQYACVYWLMDSFHKIAGVQFQVSAGPKVRMEGQVKVGCACAV